MHLKIIKSQQDHAEALERLDTLMDLEPDDGSAESDELDVLALLIERYEQENFPLQLPTPVEAIRFRMDQQGLKNKDLIPYIGSAPKVSEVLNGKRPLSLSMIRKLNQGLGIPADILIQDTDKQSHYEQDIDWQAFPLAEMRKRGYFSDFSGSLHRLKEYAAEYVGSFFADAKMELQARSSLLMRSSAHLRENDKEVDHHAALAWQARVLILAHSRRSLPKYVPGTVTQEWMRELVRLSWSQQGPALAVEYLNRHGIHLVFEPHFPKTYLDGAVCLSESQHPVIALTLRHDRLDNFWFTLMHELAHVALHFDGSENWFLDDLDTCCADPKEDEADALAQEVLIPGKAVAKGFPADVADVEALARELNISPCIIAGRIRREAGNYQLFGTAFRSEKQVSSVLKAAGYI